MKPASTVKNMIPSAEKCSEIVQRCIVRNPGWSYPNFNIENLHFGGHWIQSANRSMERIEFWQYFQRGMFIHYFSMAEDYCVEEEYLIKACGEQHRSLDGRYLCISNLLFTLTTIYEFGARLASMMLLGPVAEVHIALVKVKYRKPFMIDNGQSLCFSGHCEEDEIQLVRELFDFDLAARASEIALEDTLGILKKFQVDFPENILKEKQKKFWMNPYALKNNKSSRSINANSGMNTHPN